MSKKQTKVTFLDSDLAQLFSVLEETRLTAVQCALFVQAIDYLVRKQLGRKRKSILIAIPVLHREWFPYLSYSATKRIVQRLRRLGVLKTKIEYTKKGPVPKRATRIWIQVERIVELAEQVQGEVELKEMARRVNGK